MQMFYFWIYFHTNQKSVVHTPAIEATQAACSIQNFIDWFDELQEETNPTDIMLLRRMRSLAIAKSEMKKKINQIFMIK